MDIKEIKKDRLRYSKNSISATLIYLAIVANVLYFASIYRSDVSTYYYNWTIGASVIFNLLFMLTAFLCSEGVKQYHFGYAVTAFVIGLIQIGRIFYIPMKAHAAVVELSDGPKAVMSDSQFLSIVIYLLVSSVLLILAGIIGMVKSTTLKNYQKELAARANQ